MENFEEIKTDVLIIGSEAAGARAAIEAARQGLDVTVVTKGMEAKSGVTMLAVYSCNAALGHEDPRDNPDVHFRDTVIGGRFINDQRLVDVFTREAPDRVLEMEEFGIGWDKKGDKFEQGWMPGHTYPRSLHVDWRTGTHFSQALQREIKKSPRVKVMNFMFVTDLIQSEGKVGGAFAINMIEGTFVVLRAKATVVATGGGMYLYDVNSGSYESTGDGFAHAYRVGAQLMDMEFVQVFPACMAYPYSIRGQAGAGTLRYFLNAKLYNREGERFMRHYDPENMELATRDVVAQAIFREIKSGKGSPHGGVWMDCSYLPRNIIEAQVDKVMGGRWKWSGIDLRDYGIDITTMAAEVTPAIHYSMGGIRIDEGGYTGVEGLFAGGEAIAGIDGANRLAGNALSACLVTGYRAGKFAGHYAAEAELPGLDSAIIEEIQKNTLGLLDSAEGESPVPLRIALQKLMWSHVGVVRKEEELLEAIDKIGEMRRKKLKLTTRARRFNREWIEAMTLRNMFDIGEMMARSALMRSESRGAHFREEYPESDDKNWLKNVVLKTEDGSMSLDAIPVAVTKLDPEEVSGEQE